MHGCRDSKDKMITTYNELIIIGLKIHFYKLFLNVTKKVKYLLNFNLKFLCVWPVRSQKQLDQFSIPGGEIIKGETRRKQARKVRGMLTPPKMHQIKYKVSWRLFITLVPKVLK